MTTLRRIPGALALLICACAINPKTRSPVLTLGVDIVWKLHIKYSYKSSDAAGKIMQILEAEGYYIDAVNNDPLLLTTTFRNTGDPWIKGIETYRPSIAAFGPGQFMLTIEPRKMMATASNPTPPMTDAILRTHFESIMKPLASAFMSLGWERIPAAD